MSERLTDEQLRAVARSFTEQSIEAAAVNEAIVLRARVAKLEAVLLENYDEINVLRARVAKLEAALKEARGWVQDDVNLDHRHRGWGVLDRIDAALEDAPQ